MKIIVSRLNDRFMFYWFISTGILLRYIRTPHRPAISDDIVSEEEIQQNHPLYSIVES